MEADNAHLKGPRNWFMGVFGSQGVVVAALCPQTLGSAGPPSGRGRNTTEMSSSLGRFNNYKLWGMHVISPI
jgi:hypothetical protein